MEYFTIQGATPREALATMKRVYGPDARIHSHRPIRMGGVLGLFTREGVEITGFVEPSTPERATPARQGPFPSTERRAPRRLESRAAGAQLESRA